jgi:glycosyltransferase involved in cell wall biosynthesis
LKIALLTEYADIGGGEKNLLNLAVELKKHVEVVVFCPPGSLSTALSSHGVLVEDLGLRITRRWLGFLPLPFPAAPKERFRRFDIVHAYSPNVLPYLFLLARPLLWTTHGPWEKPYGLRGRVVSRFVQRVICVSGDVFEKTQLPCPIKVRIPLGAPVQEKISYKALDPQNPVFSCIARFQKVKGQDIFLDALGRCSFGAGVSPTIYFIGGVNENVTADHRFREEVVRQAAQLANPNVRIFFEGYSDRVGDYIARSDCIVIPSRYESFSMVAIEALAAGRPLIAPNTGGPAEIVNSSSIGILFNPGDPTSLAAALERAITFPVCFDSTACRVRGECYSSVAQAKAHLELYEEVLRKAQ